MSAAAAYATIRRLGPLVSTREAAAALGVGSSSASRTLRILSERGLVRRFSHGRWLVDEGVTDPRALAEEITQPYPAYISFTSALLAHDVIDQVPRAITVASLARPRRVRTKYGTFVLRRIPPELFGGFSRSNNVPLASVEKAIFDHVYATVANGRRSPRLPELDLPAGFSRREVDRWVARIREPRLRRRVANSLAVLLPPDGQKQARPVGSRMH